MPIAITKDLIPASFEEVQKAYQEGKIAIISVDGITGEAVGKKYLSQTIKVRDWALMMSAKWYFPSKPCQCLVFGKRYPLVKSNDENIFEICPHCNGTLSIRNRKDT